MVERSKRFIDPATGLGLTLIFSLVVGLYNILEVNALNKRMDAITAVEEENLATLKKIISATVGIARFLKSRFLTTFLGNRDDKTSRTMSAAACNKNVDSTSNLQPGGH